MNMQIYLTVPFNEVLTKTVCRFKCVVPPTASTYLNHKAETKRLNPEKKKSSTACTNDITQEVWGHRERTVRCTDNNGLEIAEYHCKLLHKRPENTERCLLTKKLCPQTVHYRWRAGNWTRCSRNCGSKGIKTRTVDCTRIEVNSPPIVVDDNHCTRGGRKKKPKVERGCARFHCPYKWITTEWSEVNTVTE